MKLRLPGRRDRAETTATTSPDASADLTEQLVRGSGKGRPTPKRSEAQGRRPGPPPPPPTTRKEAYRRMRDRAATRSEARGGGLRGDASNLPARDRGPVRKLVRDVVDARRNVGTYFIAIAGVALVGTIAPSLEIRMAAMFVLYGFFLLLVVDSVVLVRRIKKKIAERFPDGTQSTRGVGLYGISRSTMIRRWRYPKPDVPVGAEI